MTADRDRGLARQRLWNLLEGARFGSPQEAVHWLTAVQAQEYLPSLWSVAQRMTVADETSLATAIDDGLLLRTHVLRPTWHLAAPDDLRLLLAATAHRVHVKNGSMYRQFELDERTRGRCRELIADMLAGGIHLTRKQVAERLAEHGIEASRYRLAYIMMDAELEGVVCSGPRAGKQHTYALLDERAPASRRLDRDDAVVELVRRYLASHGPATIKDMQAWSSLRLADLRPSFEELADVLHREEHGGRTYWSLPPVPTPTAPSATVHLVQGYDEYFMGYLDSRHVVDVAGVADSLHPDAVTPNHVVLVDSQVAGNWDRKVTGRTVTIDAYLYDRPDGDTERALWEQAEAHGRFLGLEADLAIHDRRALG